MSEPVVQDSEPGDKQLTALAFLQGRQDALLARIVQVEESVTELRQCLQSLEARLTEAERY